MAGGQIGYRWQTGSWVFGLEARATGPICSGSNVSLLNPAQHQPVPDRRVRPVHRPGRLRLQHRSAVLQGRRAPSSPIATTSLRQRRALSRLLGRQPLGRHGRHRPRIRLRSELVGWRSSTTICSSATAPRPSPTPPAARCSAPTAFPGRRSGHRPRQLSLGRPGRREVLIASLNASRIWKRPASRRPFCLAACRLLPAAANALCSRMLAGRSRSPENAMPATNR